MSKIELALSILGIWVGVHAAAAWLYWLSGEKWARSDGLACMGVAAMILSIVVTLIVVYNFGPE